MATARLKFDTGGALIAFFRDSAMIALYDSGVPAHWTVDLDPETNQAIIAGVDSDWNGWTYDGAELRSRGVLVPINPPGEVKQLEDLRPALLQVLRANGWDGLTPLQRTRVILLLLVAGGGRG